MINPSYIQTTVWQCAFNRAECTLF